MAQLKLAATPCIGDHQLKKEEFEIFCEFVLYLLILFPKMCIFWPELDDGIFVDRKHFSESSHKVESGARPKTAIFSSYIRSTVDYRMIKSIIASWFKFRTPLLLEICRVQSQRQVECCGACVANFMDVQEANSSVSQQYRGRNHFSGRCVAK